MLAADVPDAVFLVILKYITPNPANLSLEMNNEETEKRDVISVKLFSVSFVLAAYFLCYNLLSINDQCFSLPVINDQCISSIQ